MENTNLNKSVYIYIKCLNGKKMLVGQERLNKLFGLMPGLSFILLGHPNMKKKELVEEDGIQVLTISDDFEISVDMFCLLLTCALEVTSVPDQNDIRRANLINTANKFGGCEMLEKKIETENDLKKRRHVINPVSDTLGLYEWRVFMDISETYKAQMDGFVFAFSEGPNLYHFRRPRIDHGDDSNV